MKRVVGTVVAFVVLLLVLAIPAFVFGADPGEPAKDAASSVANEPTSITRYDADFTLDDGGDLRVVETLAVDFPSGDRHGIFRFWDRLDTSDPHVRRIVRDVAVTMDGDPEPFEMQRKEGGRFDVAKIGAADITLAAGLHTYVIRYTIPGVIAPGADGVEETSQFYWQLIPAGWRQGIDRARLTVHLPADSGGVECVVGVGKPGDDGVQPCRVRGAGSRDLRISVGSLDHNTPVTLRTGLDVATPPAGTTVPWVGRLDPVLGQDVDLLVGVLLLSLVAAGVGALLTRRAFERTPQLPLMYAPPEGVGPAQAAYVLTERTSRTTYVASLMHAAEHGAVTLSRDGDAWTITDQGGAEKWASLDPVTATVAHVLGGPGSSFTADPDDVTAGERLKTEIASFESTLKTWATTSGNLVALRLGGVLGLAVLGAFGLALAAVIWNPASMSVIGLVPGSFAILGAPLTANGSATKRTAQGRELWSRAGGFKRILSTTSAEDRFEFSGREELYTAYVPWAVAFGCADEWAGKFRTEMGHEPPTPHYFVGGYYGATGFSSGIESMVADFDSAVGSAISSYDATQSSSSGGGFSGGGGGGGGGGGSW